MPALQDALRHLTADDGSEQPAFVRARLHFGLAQSAVAGHMPRLLRESLRAARLSGQDPASVYNLRGCLARKERQFPKVSGGGARAVAGQWGTVQRVLLGWADMLPGPPSTPYFPHLTPYRAASSVPLLS